MIAKFRIAARGARGKAICAGFVLPFLTAASLAQTQTPATAPTEWDKLPRMQLERQFAGPLRDTIVQRWRDPVDGTVCYIYLPITAPHSDVRPSGFVEYGSNIIGSINCLPRPTARAPAPVASSRPVRPAPAPGATAPQSTAPAAAPESAAGRSP